MPYSLLEVRGFFKVPITSKFLFPYLKVHITKQTSAQKFSDLVKTGFFFYEFLNTLKLAAILAHHSHQSPLCYIGVVTYVKEHVTLMPGKQ